MRICLTIALFLTLGLGAAAQIAEIRTYGGLYADRGAAIKETDTGYIIAATTSSSDNGNTDVYLLHILEDLSIDWAVTLGGDGAEEAKDVLVLEDGSLLILAQTSLGSNGGYDMVLFKTEADGTLIWEEHYGGADWEFASAMTMASNGIHLVGQTFSESPGTERMLKILVDEDGAQLDYDTYDIIPKANAEDIITYNDGLYMIGTREFDGEPSQGIIRKLELNGAIEWQAVQDSVNFQGNALAASNLGIAAAYAKEDQQQDGTWDMFTVNYDEDGTELWHRWTNTDVTGNQIPAAIVWYNFDVTQAAMTDVFGQGGEGIFLNRMSFEGALLSSAVFGGGADDYPADLIMDSQNRMLFLGTAASFGGGDDDVYLGRLPDDNILPEPDYDIQFEDLTDDDFFIGIFENDRTVPTPWPNPAIETVNVPIEVESWVLMDATGKQIQNGNVRSIYVADLESGMYFLQMQFRGQYFTKAIVIR